MKASGRRFKSNAITVLCLLVLPAFSAPTHAGVIKQIDPYPLEGTRKIPDINGSPGDSVELAPDEIIDIVILADGYLLEDSLLMWDSSSTQGAWGWYFQMFGGGPNNEPGVRPYNLFREAFRVRANFEASTSYADTLRSSFYKTDVDSTGKIGFFDIDNQTQADTAFRIALFNSIFELDPPLVKTSYSSTLDNTVDGVQGIGVMSDRYRNIYVIMFARTDVDGVKCVSGGSMAVKRLDEPQWVKIGIGCGTMHEFGHTFGYVLDEYLTTRKKTADSKYKNPHPDSISVFNLNNLAFSNSRCVLPWLHLAPGSQHNPKVRSLIGNLWTGSSRGEFGTWHSEYLCAYNGKSDNYFCATSDTTVDRVSLRDSDHACFMCEEIISLRILERTGQFERIVGTSGNVNTDGRDWYQAWDAGLRDKHYAYFNYDSLIASKNKCFNLWDAGSSCQTCSTSCNGSNESWPRCLPACDLREIGNAIYVNGDTGVDGLLGHKNSPVKAINFAVAVANTQCPDFNLIVIEPASYPGSLIITDPAVLFTDGCNNVIVGK